jgi:hypothetical protein
MSPGFASVLGDSSQCQAVSSPDTTPHARNASLLDLSIVPIAPLLISFILPPTLRLFVRSEVLIVAHS